MYSQFFGSYLLQNQLITSEQLMDAVSKLSKSKIKIGTIAMTQGLMTPAEIDECLYIQKREDKRFGEIAVERGYLSPEQVDQLLNEQVSDFILLGQTLVENGCFTYTDLERYIFDYESANEMYDLDQSVENKEKVLSLIDNFFITANLPSSPRVTMYLELLFNSLIRFIGDDFTPFPPMLIEEFPINYAVSQKIEGTSCYITTIDIDRNAAIEFASRYANDYFDSFNEYVLASIEDFINLHNGLFLVNISNSENEELVLSPPERVDAKILPSVGTTVLIPILYPFGRINLIVSF